MPQETPFVSACESCEMEIPADDLPEPTEDGFPAPNVDSELQIAAQTPWQGAAENIRTLFLSEEPEELMLGDGYSYVRAPMPEGSEFAFMNIGVKLENGAPVGIAYAFPGSYSADGAPGAAGVSTPGSPGGAAARLRGCSPPIRKREKSCLINDCQVGKCRRVCCSSDG